MELLSLNGNWVDLVIILIFVYYASEAWRVGLWAILADFAAFVLSLLFALRAYTIASHLLQLNFSLSRSLSNAVGFLIVAGLSQTLLSILFGVLISKIPKKYWDQKWSRALAIFPAIGQGIVMVAFLLTLIIGLPLKPGIKDDVSNSKIGGTILKRTSGIESKLNEIFGGAIEESISYLTVKQGSHESIQLTPHTRELTIDEESERKMVELVNGERKNNGVGQLTIRPELIPVARAHAKDMWERSYFSHYSPEGKDVGDRLTENNIYFSFAGENLALAPTLAIAHDGLMNSPGHRANILNPKFKQVGIGVIDNGYDGKMFVQIFTD
jgi:uncharacterized protein YkwD